MNGFSMEHHLHIMFTYVDGSVYGKNGNETKCFNLDTILYSGTVEGKSLLEMAMTTPLR